MRVFLYYRTYWGKGSGPGWLGRNVLAKNKREMVEVCLKSADLDKQEIYSYACVDNSTKEYTEFLKPIFSELFHTSEGFDISDFRNRWPIFGGRGSAFRMFNLMEKNHHADDDVVLVLEDDYLFINGGFEEWVEACKNFDGFVSPFDHPSRYIRNDDIFAKKSEIFVHNNRHWREVEGSTGVVGARYKYFRKTLFIRKIPRLRIGPYYPGRLVGRELTSMDILFYRRIRFLFGIKLFSPIPGIASHLSIFKPPPPKYLKRGCKIPATELSPGVDWEKRYNEILRRIESGNLKGTDGVN